VATAAAATLDVVTARAATRPDYQSLLQEHSELQRSFSKRRSSAAEMAVNLKVWRCRLTLSNPEMKARLVSTLETKL